MISYEILCFIDDDKIVKYIECRNYSEESVVQEVWSEYIGKPIDNFLHIDLEKDCGYVVWNSEIYRYTKTKNKLGKGYIINMTSTLNKAKLYEEAMDYITEGVQVFDKKGYLIFCNKISERLEKTNRKNIIGKHLLDIYDLNEDYSTILNTLKTKKPVLNRCDTFKNKDGDMIITINSGYPLFDGNELIGAVSTVQDMTVLENFWEKINDLEEYISKENYKKNLSDSSNYYTFKYYTFKDLIGENSGFKETIKLAQKVALKDCPVLIYGETGTGKELFAQSIHSASKRKDREFVAVNCAAIPDNLIEGILFGTEKGAFTGSTNRIGLFEQAEGGTLFLDELNSMNLHMQSKLLRVIQEKKFRHVGGLKDINCDVRIISSTNEEPFKSIENNRLRQDLYFRLSTVTINIPPLRSRKDDIDILTDYFLNKLSRHYFKEVTKITDEAKKVLKEYDWPGNVRELLHVIEYSFNIIDNDVIGLEHLPKYIQTINNKEDYKQMGQCKTILQEETLEEIMSKYEKEVIGNILKKYNYNITKTANVLGIKRQSLQYRIKKYGL